MIAVMRNFLRKKWLLSIVAVCVVAAAICASYTAVSHYDHNCADDDCLVCLQAENAQNFLKALGTAALLTAVFAFALRRTTVSRPPRAVSILLITPITLKVRLNT